MKPTFPAVGGGEGVGVVTSTGAAVTSMKAGDWVVPARTGMLGESICFTFSILYFLHTESLR